MKKMMIMLATLCAAFAMTAQEAGRLVKPVDVKSEKKSAEKAERPARQGGQRMMLERIKKDAAELLALYDADKDGKISATEVAQFKKDYEVYKKLSKFNFTLNALELIDANHDFVIDAEEEKNIKDIVSKMRPQQRGQRPDRGERPQRGERPDAAPAPEAAE